MNLGCIEKFQFLREECSMIRKYSKSFVILNFHSKNKAKLVPNFCSENQAPVLVNRDSLPIEPMVPRLRASRLRGASHPQEKKEKFEKKEN